MSKSDQYDFEAGVDEEASFKELSSVACTFSLVIGLIVIITVGIIFWIS